MNKLSCRVSGLSFCDIGRHRDCRTPHLNCEPESLVAWKLLTDQIDKLYERDPFLPNEKVSVTADLRLAVRHKPSLVSYLRGRLLTYHLSLVTGVMQ